jgi:hypothetical protein
LLATRNFSSLSHALRRDSSVRFARLLTDRLAATARYRRGELVAIDSMAVTLQSRLRHRCEKVNDTAVGGGLLWAYRIRSAAGECPVRLLKSVRGAWHDTRLMADVALEPRGPVYLMDRGFYRIDQIAEWLDDRVRFIVRARAKDLHYEIVKTLTKPRRLANGWQLFLDAYVRLGSDQRRGSRPVVRLVTAVSPRGQQFDYVTSEKSPAVQIIADYGQRWHIERFHRFLKENLALAHLYSFDANGLEFLALTALVCAMLLAMGHGPHSAASETIQILQQALRQLQKPLGLGAIWRRNTLATRRGRRRSRSSYLPPQNH